MDKYNKNNNKADEILNAIKKNIKNLTTTINNAEGRYNNLNISSCNIKLENTQEILNRAKQELKKLKVEIEKSAK